MHKRLAELNSFLHNPGPGVKNNETDLSKSNINYGKTTNSNTHTKNDSNTNSQLDISFKSDGQDRGKNRDRSNSFENSLNHQEDKSKRRGGTLLFDLEEENLHVLNEYSKFQYEMYDVMDHISNLNLKRFEDYYEQKMNKYTDDYVLIEQTYLEDVEDNEGDGDGSEGGGDDYGGGDGFDEGLIFQADIIKDWGYDGNQTDSFQDSPQYNNLNANVDSNSDYETPMPFAKDEYNRNNVLAEVELKDELYTTADANHECTTNQNKVSLIRKEVIKSFTAQLNGYITNDNDETDSDSDKESYSKESETHNLDNESKDESKNNLSKHNCNNSELNKSKEMKEENEGGKDEGDLYHKRLDVNNGKKDEDDEGDDAQKGNTMRGFTWEVNSAAKKYFKNHTFKHEWYYYVNAEEEMDNKYLEFDTKIKDLNLYANYIANSLMYANGDYVTSKNNHILLDYNREVKESYYSNFININDTQLFKNIDIDRSKIKFDSNVLTRMKYYAMNLLKEDEKENLIKESKNSIHEKKLMQLIKPDKYYGDYTPHSYKSKLFQSKYVNDLNYTNNLRKPHYTFENKLYETNSYLYAVVVYRRQFYPPLFTNYKDVIVAGYVRKKTYVDGKPSSYNEWREDLLNLNLLVCSIALNIKQVYMLNKEYAHLLRIRYEALNLDTAVTRIFLQNGVFPFLSYNNQKYDLNQLEYQNKILYFLMYVGKLYEYMRELAAKTDSVLTAYCKQKYNVILNSLYKCAECEYATATHPAKNTIVLFNSLKSQSVSKFNINQVIESLYRSMFCNNDRYKPESINFISSIAGFIFNLWNHAIPSLSTAEWLTDFAKYLQINNVGEEAGNSNTIQNTDYKSDDEMDVIKNEQQIDSNNDNVLDNYLTLIDIVLHISLWDPILKRYVYGRILDKKRHKLFKRLNDCQFESFNCNWNFLTDFISSNVFFYLYMMNNDLLNYFKLVFKMYFDKTLDLHVKEAILDSFIGIYADEKLIRSHNIILIAKNLHEFIGRYLKEINLSWKLKETQIKIITIIRLCYETTQVNMYSFFQTYSGDKFLESIVEIKDLEIIWHVVELIKIFSYEDRKYYLSCINTINLIHYLKTNVMNCDNQVYISYFYPRRNIKYLHLYLATVNIIYGLYIYDENNRQAIYDEYGESKQSLFEIIITYGYYYYKDFEACLVEGDNFYQPKDQKEFVQLILKFYLTTMENLINKNQLIKYFEEIDSKKPIYEEIKFIGGRLAVELLQTEQLDKVNIINLKIVELRTQMELTNPNIADTQQVKQGGINLNFYKQMRKAFQVKLEMYINWSTNDPCDLLTCISTLHKEHRMFIKEMQLNDEYIYQGPMVNTNPNDVINYNEVFKKIITNELEVYTDVIKDNLFRFLQGDIFIPTEEDRGLNYTKEYIKSIIEEHFPHPLDLLLQQFYERYEHLVENNPPGFEEKLDKLGTDYETWFDKYGMKQYLEAYDFVVETQYDKALQYDYEIELRMFCDYYKINIYIVDSSGIILEKYDHDKSSKIYILMCEDKFLRRGKFYYLQER